MHCFNNAVKNSIRNKYNAQVSHIDNHRFKVRNCFTFTTKLEPLGTSGNHVCKSVADADITKLRYVDEESHSRVAVWGPY